MNKKLVFLIIGVFALSGCTVAHPKHASGWYKKGHNAKTALAKCKYEIGINKISIVQQDDMIKNCMIGQGYRWI